MDNQRYHSALQDLTRGYAEEHDGAYLVCAFCGERYAAERVYPRGEGFLTARGAVEAHVADAHGGAFEAVLAQGAGRAGLSEVTETVLRGMRAGEDDQAIAAALGGKALATVRSHRRNLRLKAEEARRFLALMALAEEKSRPAERLVDYGPAMPVRDERALATETEAQATLKAFMRPDGSLVRIPPKEKQKLVVLKALAERFERGRDYGDAELRDILKPVHEDYALLRRYLVDYRFLERDGEGRRYRRP